MAPMLIGSVNLAGAMPPRSPETTLYAHRGEEWEVFVHKNGILLASSPEPIPFVTDRHTRVQAELRQALLEGMKELNARLAIQKEHHHLGLYVSPESSSDCENRLFYNLFEDKRTRYAGPTYAKTGLR